MSIDFIKPGIWLDCGCCGLGFKTWQGYADQDQDAGYGICLSCQQEIGDRNEAEFDKMINVLKGGLEGEQLDKFNNLTREQQKGACLWALDKGILKFGVEKCQAV